ncbi:hypothetical protein HMPREF1624_01727 [Sporothrix schenckii ATCC 58251]|uniref:Uncharacterized protein n=1 Tax=Sporothrix schenckii (strain ATCC 58251 / de Perez 2211183) TaxID=1391915 RepID=U7Q896_SPOS1|nr:hypothetical protein HMPREF1624_01727 [Sporothrix schenckii ATCC 58251]
MDATDYDEQYFIFDKRLSSFQGPQPVAKRRPSTAAGSRAPKALTWPHKSPAPIDLARAGFFFNPQPSNPDNVRCFLCHKDLDGWEEDDDPLQEHLKHSGSCGWAICAAIELELGDVVNEDPRLPYLLEARKSTFGGRWPYESKKGWKCKTKQLAEAGWKYTPTLESDDNTTCTYCQLALDGWEASDKPMDEHQRRSPNCPFFTLISTNPAPKKTTRGKSARTSKATRLSIQSVATVTSDAQSVADPDDSILTTTTVVTQGGRKTTRPRKTATGTTTAKGRKTRTKKDEPVPVPEPEPEVESTIIPEEEAAAAEPQPPVPTKTSRGKKRTSDEIDSAAADAAEAPAPKKKRATRVRASNNAVQAERNDYAMFDPMPREADESAIDAELRALEKDMEVDVDMDQQLQQQLEKEQEQEIQVPKKGRKTGTRKASKQIRKAKAASVAPEPEIEIAAPEPEVPQQDKEPEPEPEPEPQPEVQQPDPPTAGYSSIPEAKPKTNGKTKSKKLSLPPRQSTQPRLSLHDIEQMEGPDELHEESLLSVGSSGTVVHEAVEEPEPAPPAAAPPAKRGRGRPPKKSAESTSSSVRSSAAEQAIQAQLQATVPTKITPIPPPSIPAVAMSAEQSAPKKRKSSNVSNKETVVPTAAKKSQTDKDKALPPLPQSKPAQQKRESHAGITPVPVPALVSMPARVESPAPATPRKQQSPVALAKQATLSPSQSPQSSDAENQPPSSRPATTSAKGKRVALAPIQMPLPAANAVTPGGVSTPVRTGSPSKRANILGGGLRSAISWSAVDVDAIFGLNKENGDDILKSLLRKGTDLSTPEKGMTVEEFIFHNAGQAERLLKEECEAMVSIFEQQGSRAMHVLESLEVEE